VTCRIFCCFCDMHRILRTLKKRRASSPQCADALLSIFLSQPSS
jgi:hypothetical protein